jgi:hypothetical protein
MAVEGQKEAKESEKSLLSEIFFKFNLQSIVKFLIIILMNSFTTADLLCEERATTMLGGRSFLLLYRIKKTIFGKREKVKKKSRKKRVATSNTL